MDEKDLKRFMIPMIILGLALLSFLIIKPIAFPIFLGLLLAFGLYPLYLKLNAKLNHPNISASILVIGALLVLLLPPIMLLPTFMKELFQAYLSFTNTDLSSVIFHAFPILNSSPEMASQISASASHFNAAISSGMLSLFQSTLMNLPAIIFGVVILLFTFFFGLREGHEFKGYFSAFFPFGEENKKRFFERFEQVTNSVVLGHIVIGAAQGLVAGIAYYMFGIPNALILTVITMIVGVLPVIGPWLVWIPVDFFLFSSGNSVAGMQLLIYGLFVINWTEVLLRPYVVAARAEMNSAVALIGAVGGTYAFGVMGFLLGPLFLAYFILVIELYKDKKSESLIIKESPEIKS